MENFVITGNELEFIKKYIRKYNPYTIFVGKGIFSVTDLTSIASMKINSNYSGDIKIDRKNLGKILKAYKIEVCEDGLKLYGDSDILYKYNKSDNVDIVSALYGIYKDDSMDNVDAIILDPLEEIKSPECELLENITYLDNGLLELTDRFKGITHLNDLETVRISKIFSNVFINKPLNININPKIFIKALECFGNNPIEIASVNGCLRLRVGSLYIHLKKLNQKNSITKKILSIHDSIVNKNK